MKIIGQDSHESRLLQNLHFIPTAESD